MKKAGKRGRFDREAVLSDVIDWVAEGRTVRDFCRQGGKPCYQTVYEWLNEIEEADGELTRRFARARKSGFDAIAMEALRIADTPLEGVTTTKDGGDTKTVTQDMLGHRKLQIETRLKLLAKWDPGRYGDKMTLAGDKDAPLTLSDTERMAKLEALVEAVRGRAKGVDE